MSEESEERHSAAVAEYRETVYDYNNHRLEVDRAREDLRNAKKDHAETVAALQDEVGETVGHVQTVYKDERYGVKTNCGYSLLVGCSSKVDKEKLVPGTRVCLQDRTDCITRILPPQVAPLFVHDMLFKDRGLIEYTRVGGLSKQIEEVKLYIERPLVDPEIFRAVGVKPPKSVLLHGPPGTGKTLLAKAIASNTNANFLQIVSSALVETHLGESARKIREIFRYAQEHQPCIIFMDEIDAIGGRRLNEGTSGDREIQRTLMELLNQLDGFDKLEQVKILMATNRLDALDPALTRPGRIDRKIEIPLPNESSRTEILKIHALPMAKHGEIDFEALAKLSEGFNGADLSNVCTEAAVFTMRAERDYVTNEDFMKAVRKVNEAKKVEPSAD